jgi:hypothetical protein
MSPPYPYIHIPSTLKPAEVAVAMVQSAVRKHNTRIDMIFFKGVRRLALLLSSTNALSISS